MKRNTTVDTFQVTRVSATGGIREGGGIGGLTGGGGTGWRDSRRKDGRATGRDALTHLNRALICCSSCFGII